MYLILLRIMDDLPSDDQLRGGRYHLAGGWCFSDGRRRWPVSARTAEALVALLQAEDEFGAAIKQPISPKRCQAAVRFLLSRQNDDGGVGTDERQQAGGVLEHINPSQMYGNGMTERRHLECTACSLRGLAAARIRHGMDWPARL